MEYSLEVIQLMHPGQRKDRAGNPHQEDSTFPEAKKLNNSNRLFLVCDGMGGHDAGEVASDTVCTAIGNHITSHCTEAGAFTPKDLDSAIAAAFDALDAADTGSPRKMGTTMTLLKLYDKGAIIAHIGDSRVYQIRPLHNHESAKVMHRTCDHSLVSNMIKAGIMTEEEARTSPHKNVITKALQPHLENRPKPDITKITDIKPGDFFYLCSDGMLENMDSKELEEVFAKEGKDLERLRDTLLELTKDNHDNHTAMIVRILSVTKADNEDLSDDFDNKASKPDVAPPPFKKEQFDKPSVSNHGSSNDDEITCLFGQEESPDTLDDDSERRKSRRRRWIWAIVVCIVVISAVIAYLSGLFSNISFSKIF